MRSSCGSPGGDGGGWGQTLATGFRVISVTTPPKGQRSVVTTDLQPDHRYSVIMTRREWVWRFGRMFKEDSKELPEITPVDGGTFRVLAEYIVSTPERYCSVWPE